MKKRYEGSGEGVKSLSEAVFSDKWFKEFVESYRCRICKTDLTLDNFGGLGPNHGIFCKSCV